MLRLAVEIEGHASGDIELALEEVLRHVREGYVSGANSNDTGRYFFHLTGKEETANA